MITMFVALALLAITTTAWLTSIHLEMVKLRHRIRLLESRECAWRKVMRAAESQDEPTILLDPSQGLG